jgi:probable F420-dependent oxidoreductase
MDFGVNTSGLELSRLISLAQTAEGVGFTTFYPGDHLVLAQTGVHPEHEPILDAMTSAAALFAATRKLRVGHLVLNNSFRHPMITAQALMTLDHIGGGRLIAGIGTGWTEQDFIMSGIPFPDMKARGEMLDEALTCIRSLWTEEVTNFSGKHYKLRDAVMWPKPIQKPYPPIMVGGGGRPIVRIAAKHADISNITWELGRAGKFDTRYLTEFNETRFRERIDYMADQCERNGRPRNAVAVSNLIGSCVVTDSDAATAKMIDGVGRALAFTTEQVRHCPMLLIGTAEACIAELRSRVKAFGVSQFIVTTKSEKTVRTLGEKVFPFVK